MKKKTVTTVLLSLISLALIFVFVYYLYDNSDKYLELFQASVADLIALSALSFAFPLISGVINTYLFKSFGADISYWEGFLLAASSSLANQLPISGGIVSKGFYLKRKHNISYTKFISATMALSFCFLAVNGLIGLSILIYWVISKNVAFSPLLIGGFTFMAAFFLVFLLPFEKVKFPKKMRNWIFQAIGGWTLISKNPYLVLRLIGLQTGLTLLLAIRYWLAFQMLSQNVTICDTLLFSTASVLTQLVSFAPGGLGVREAIVGAVALALGFDMGVSVVAVGLDRLISTSVVLLVGGISAVILSSQISKENGV